MLFKSPCYLQVRRISMFALNCTITSVLASKVTVKSCYVFYWSDPSVSSGNKKKKKGIHWNFCCCCFLKIKNVLKKKTKKKKTKPGTLLQPVKPITKQKNLAIVKPISQIILWMPKNIFWQSSSTARNRKLVIMEKKNWKLFSNKGLKTHS